MTPRASRPLLLLSLLALLGCSVATPAVADASRLVTQQADDGCAIAVLAMAAGIDYERADDVMGPRNHRGTTDQEFLVAAWRLGLHFQPQAPVNLDREVGALNLAWCHEEDGPLGRQVALHGYHMVWLEHGVIYDPLGVVQTWGLYEHEHCVVAVLLWERMP